MSFVKQLWDDGDVAFIHDVGAMVRPTTKEQYINDKKEYTPEGLFGHNTQQAFIQASGPESSNGWFGRTANIIDPLFTQGGDPIFNIGQKVTTSAFTLQGSDLQSKTYPPMSSLNYPATVLRSLDGFGLVTDDDIDDAEEQIRHSGDNPAPRDSNLLVDSFVDIFNTAVRDQASVVDNVFTWNDDDNLTQEQKDDINQIFTDAIVTSPVAGWVSLVQKAAEIIYSAKSEGYNQRRQTIFVPMGGWDHHASLREQHDSKIEGVDYAIKSLVLFLKEVGLYDSVVIAHEADFNRTLRSNGNLGVDHAWATHSFVVGGPVKGGFYPTNYMPNYDTDGIKSEGSTLGRYIPEVSIDQYYAEILEWFGIPRQHLDLVLPELPKFTTNNNQNYIFANQPPGVEYSIDFI